ncbi:MAG: cupin domain-containing protein [Phaeodactylibacter sp.]|nr:cupin domain-containing protein [Phaeodactylibacter sp.]MCB9273358.1 cupin domain-containing protein [Lewinellaceae bacterium]
MDTIINPVTGQKLIFIQTGKTTGGRLLEMESHYVAKSKEPAPHYHPFQREHFTMLEGEMHVRLKSGVQHLKKGDEIVIEPGEVHSMWNPADAPAVVNWKVSPAMETEAFFRTVYSLASEGKTNAEGRPRLLQAALLAVLYAGEFRLARPRVWV